MIEFNFMNTFVNLALALCSAVDIPCHASHKYQFIYGAPLLFRFRRKDRNDNDLIFTAAQTAYLALTVHQQNFTVLVLYSLQSLKWACKKNNSSSPFFNTGSNWRIKKNLNCFIRNWLQAFVLNAINLFCPPNALALVDQCDRLAVVI